LREQPLFLVDIKKTISGIVAMLPSPRFELLFSFEGAGLASKLGLLTRNCPKYLGKKLPKQKA
jgi:hypothetical protein